MRQEHRRLVALRRAGRRSHRHDRERLRGDGRRNTATCCERDPRYADKAAQDLATHQGCERSHRSRAHSYPRRSSSRAPLPSGKWHFTRLARCSTASRSAAWRRTCWRRRAGSSPRCQTPICAAARPEPTRSCNPVLSKQLLANKVAALESGSPAVVATANIGCLAHIQTGTQRPVRHWVELLDDALA